MRSIMKPRTLVYTTSKLHLETAEELKLLETTFVVATVHNHIIHHVLNFMFLRVHEFSRNQ